MYNLFNGYIMLYPNYATQALILCGKRIFKEMGNDHILL